MDEEFELKDASLSLASSRSTMVSLAGVRVGRYELNERRQNLLSRVPESGDYVLLEKDSLEMMDLAFLTAKTKDEFAILRGKNEDILFHGTPVSCSFIGELEEGLRTHKYELICHSHPGEDEPEPSLEDRTLLREIGQRSSTVISARTGRVSKFTENPFE